MNFSPSLPLIYRSEYNIGLMGLEKLHPFDTAKYGKAYKTLKSLLGLDAKQFIKFDAVSNEDLLLAHNPIYLNRLEEASVIAQVAEMGILASLPASLLKKHLLLPMRYAVQGTIEGSKQALEHGWAVNFSGGYHHAKGSMGEGFCYFADIPIAILKLWQTRPDLKVLVIDLDAHQGNGIESVLRDEPNFFMMDVYNKDIYPNDTAVKKYIDFDYPLPNGTGDDAYLASVRQGLKKAIPEAKPDLIIYNAGTDIYLGDALGGFNLSEKAVLERDALVWEAASQNACPILMVPSGGYFKESGPMIGRSLANLLKTRV
ncbi:MAG: histone deacetylase [Bacteroidota bacterium]